MNILCWGRLDQAGVAARHPGHPARDRPSRPAQPFEPPPPAEPFADLPAVLSRRPAERRAQDHRRRHALARAVSLQRHLGPAGAHLRRLRVRPLPVGDRLDPRRWLLTYRRPSRRSAPPIGCPTATAPRSWVARCSASTIGRRRRLDTRAISAPGSTPMRPRGCPTDARGLGHDRPGLGGGGGLPGTSSSCSPMGRPRPSSTSDGTRARCSVNSRSPRPTSCFARAWWGCWPRARPTPTSPTRRPRRPRCPRGSRSRTARSRSRPTARRPGRSWRRRRPRASASGW